MKSQSNQKKSKNSKKKQPFNMYVWGQKYKKVFAGTICVILAVVMILSLLQF